MTTIQRADGRGADALRPVTLTRGYTVHAEGSVLVAFGATKVLCTASVEEKVPPHKRGSGEGWVTAEYGMLPRATHTRGDREAARGKQSGRTQEIQRLIGRSMRSVFDLQALGERTHPPRLRRAAGRWRHAHRGHHWRLRGGPRRGALAAAAGRIAASPIRDAVAAVSVGIVQGTPLLDLEYTEDSSCDTDMNVVMTGRGGFVEVQGTAEGAPFSRAEMDALLALAAKGIAELVAAQKAALARHECEPTASGAGVQQRRQAGRVAGAVRTAAAGPGGPAQPGPGRGRGAARHVHRKRAGQGAARGAGQWPGGAGRRLRAVCRCAGRRAGRGLGALRQRRLAAGEREAQRRQQDAANNALLLQHLQGASTRRASFVCTLVALRSADDPQPLVATGRWQGEILAAPRGTGGFGYDPLMYIPALGATVAELPRELKNAHSHRALACRQMLQLMRDAWQLGAA